MKRILTTVTLLLFLILSTYGNEQVFVRFATDIAAAKCVFMNAKEPTVADLLIRLGIDKKKVDMNEFIAAANKAGYEVVSITSTMPEKLGDIIVDVLLKKIQ